MKVKELISQLQKLEENIEVFCISEDAMFVGPSSHFKLFNVDAVEAVHGEAGRDEKRLPTMSFGQSDHSRNYAMITITSDF